jgi:hypothetical protein
VPSFQRSTVKRSAIKAPASSRWDAEVRVLAWLAVWVSVFSFLFYYRNGAVLLYGDAVAHINIARRVFDSRTPGLLQLGTVWLPLPHLLMIPFLVSNEMWQRGVGGSIPSMVAYVFGVIGMFRLMRGVFSRGVVSPEGEPGVAAGVAAWTAAAVYGANPNLIYMQGTAMGEALYLALFIWAVVFFAEFAGGDSRALTKCGFCLAAACLTRYDGWFLAVGMVVGAVAIYCLKDVGNRDSHPSKTAKGGAASLISPSRIAIAKFILIAAAAPALWLAYNGIVYRNPLEFENGPYSAKAIEKRTQGAGSEGHPGTGNVYVAGLYFLKSAQADLAQNDWLQRLWIVLGVAAFIVMISARRKHEVEALNVGALNKDGTPGLARSPSRWPLIFLLVPIPFYALSIAYGGVPIFIPAWWPFTHYNVRYGLQLLPAFAAAVGILVHTAARSKQWPKMWRRAALLGLLVIVVVSYGFVWRAGPICYSEAAINMHSRVSLEKQVAGWLHTLPPGATLLMDLGGHPGALEQAGIPLKRTINEGNHRVWMQPSDSEGLWERALANPAALADYALAFDGDEVWRAVQGRGFKELVVIHVTGQPQAILYRVR